MIQNHTDNRYNQIISILNKILNDIEYVNYFKDKCVYVPLIVVRSQEPNSNPFTEKNNLIVKKNETYMVDFKNLPLLELRRNKVKIDSKYSLNIKLLEEKNFIDHLKRHKVYIKTMFSYMNSYYEEYLMIYASKYYNEFHFEEPFNFLIFANPTPKDSKKCTIS